MTRTDITAFSRMLPPAHPGEIVAEELKARGLDANRAALKMRIPANRLTAIMKGERAITAETALRLAALFGVSAQFFMNLQSQYDLAVATKDHGTRIAKEVEVA
ncbi:MAG: HigA family addiction module antitoxin [Hyphomicrobiales bacterium]